MSYWSNGIADLHHADARALPLPDQSVHCIVTSPPYWGLRDYDLEGGIGLEETLAEHLEAMADVGRELWRVLRDDGTLWLNYGDAYAGSWKAQGHDPELASDLSRRQVLAAGHRSTRRGSLSRNPGIGRKNQLGLPWRIAFAFQDLGWVVRRGIVWAKPNPMPESVTDRPTASHEMIFLMSKSADSLYWTHDDGRGTRSLPPPDHYWRHRGTREVRETMPEPEWYWEKGRRRNKWARRNHWTAHDYFYDRDAVRQPASAATAARLAQATIPDQRGGTKADAYEAGRVKGSKKAADRRPNEVIAHLAQSESGKFANLRDVWTIPTQQRADPHYATFPDEIPRRCILAGTSEHGVCSECGAPWERRRERTGSVARETQRINADRNDAGRTEFLGASSRTVGWGPTCECDAERVPATVLDPFVGSGTTVEVAQRLGRRAVGSDLSTDYLAIARRRVEAVTLPMAL